MWYCFIREDLDMMAEDDPLMLQCAYAKALNGFCLVDLAAGKTVDQNHMELDLAGEKVFLRGTCDYLPAALSLLQRKGCDLVETEQDIRKILHWERLGLTKRNVISLKAGDVLRGRLPDDARIMIAENPAVFLKSREKGFSAKVSSARLRDRDPNLMAVIEKHCTPEAEVLISELINIKRDSIGPKESRHVVLHNRIQNSSRPVHSLLHTVPKTLLREAENMVNQIAAIGDFPENYVLDMGLLEKDGETVAEIIELNPIGSAMCYLNNSIFTECLPGLADAQPCGWEYRLDMCTNPHRYRANRSSGECFSYRSSEQYEFL